MALAGVDVDRQQQWVAAMATALAGVDVEPQHQWVAATAMKAALASVALMSSGKQHQQVADVGISIYIYYTYVCVCRYTAATAENDNRKITK